MPALPFSKISRLIGDALGKATRPRHDKLIFETLESRILLSGDLPLPQLHGSLDVPGETDRYSFTLENQVHVVFDAQTNSSLLNWSLSGPRGSEVSARAFNASDGSGMSGNPVLDLLPGAYTLTVDGSGDATGSYDFRLLNLDHAMAITPGTAIFGTLDPGNETALYQFDATAGDQFLLDWQTTPANANWRLIDPFGGQLAGSDALGHLHLGGTYTLLIEKAVSSTLPSDYAFTLQHLGNTPPPAPVGQTLNLGETIYLPAASGQWTDFHFTVGEPGLYWFDVMDHNWGSFWTLTDPRGVALVSGRSLELSDLQLDLNAPGEYQLRVSTDSSAYFRLLDVSIATVLPPGTTVTTPAGSTDMVHLYRLPAEAGQRLYLDTSGWTRQLLDPWGRQISGWTWAATGDQEFTPSFTGDYILAVATNSANFTVRSAPDEIATLTLGTTTSGAIDQLGERDIYTFTLAQDSHLFFDTLVWGGFGSTWILTGPNGTWYSREIGSSDYPYYGDNHTTGGNPVLAASAGDYRLTFDTDYDWIEPFQEASYSFRLLDLSAATPLTLGQTAPSPSDLARDTQSWRFTAQAGERYRLVLANTLLRNHALRLIDPNGMQVSRIVNGLYNGVVELPTLGIDGNYTLLIDGSYEVGYGDSYAFSLEAATSPLTPWSGTPIALGQTVSSNIGVSGEVDNYVLTLTTPAQLLIDVLGSTGQNWTLTGPTGVQIDSRNLSEAEYLSGGNPLKTLLPGSYQIRIGGGTGSYSFRLLDANQAPLLTPGTAQSGTLTPGNSTAIYRYEGQAGQRLYLDQLASGGSVSGRLIDPHGQEISRNSFSDVDAFTLSQTGTYTVLVMGALENRNEVAYSVRISPTSSIATALEGVERAPHPDLMVADIAAAADGNIHAGGEITISWRDVNVGGRETTGSWRDRITVSDAVGQIILDTWLTSDDGFIPAGESRLRQVTLTLPAGASGIGDLTVIVQADADDTLSEGNAQGNAELNNQATLSFHSDELHANRAPTALATAPGRTLFFDGIKDYVQLAEGSLLAGRTEFTIEAWIEVGNSCGARQIYSEALISLAITPEESIEFGINVWPWGMQIARSNTALTPGWHHVAAIFSKSVGQRLYIDGKLEAELNNTSNPSDTYWSSLSLLGTTAQSNYFQGRMDEVRLWTVARSQTQIQDHMRQSLAGNETGLLHYWPFNTESGSSLYDRATSSLFGQFGSGQYAPGWVVADTPLRNIVTIWRDRSVTITLSGEDPDGDALAYVLTRLPGRGTLYQTVDGVTRGEAIPLPGTVSDPQGRVIYVPATGEIGSPFDGFAFVADDGQAASTETEVGIEVLALDESSVIRIESTFGTGTEDWLVTYMPPDYPGAPPIELDIGVPDVTFGPNGTTALAQFGFPGNVWYWTAPAAYLGDRHAAYGKEISFDLMAAYADPDIFAQPGHVILVGGPTDSPITLFASLSEPPMGDETETFNHYTLGLTENNWSLAGSGGVIGPASRADMEAVLSNLEALYIRGIYQEWWPEVGLLDNVSLGLGSGANPDLQVTGITVTQANPVSGGLLTLTWNDANTGSEATGRSWYDRIVVVNAATCTPLLNTTVYHDHGSEGGVSAGGSLARSFSFTLPDGASGAGDLRILVTADLYGDQSEYNAIGTGEGNNDSVLTVSSALAPYPDLVARNLAVSPNLQSGDTVTLTWEDANLGDGAATGSFFDYVRVRNASNMGWSYNNTLYHDAGREGAIAAGGSLARSVSFALPEGSEGVGDLLFTVVTDNRGQVYEYNGDGTAEQNNDASLTAVSVLAPPPNLQVTGITLPSLPVAGQETVIEWQVTNTGQGDIHTDYWEDQVYLSLDPVLDGSDIWLDRTENPSVPGPGESYTNSMTVELDDDISGPYWIIVKTDYWDYVFEQDREDDNVGVAGPVDISPPLPDLAVTSITSPPGAEAGHGLTISYEVANLGPSATLNESWSDGVYLSTDALLDSGDLHLGDIGHFGALPPNGEPQSSYSASGTFTLPDELGSGDYFVLVLADHSDRVNELDDANNLAAATIGITANPADLVVESASVPATGESGRAIQVDWSARNRSSGDTTARGWIDRIVLSANTLYGDVDDVYLGSLNHPGVLREGASYSGRLSLTLPFSVVPGNYHVLVAADSSNLVYEGDGEGNNTSSPQPISVTRLTPDLQVTAVSAPATGLAGTVVSVNWTVENLGANTTNANYWYDALYLSNDATLDDGDRRLANLYHANLLDPGQTYLGTADITLPAELATGDYYLLVKTDSGNQVLEDPLEGNNIGRSATIAVTANPAALVPPVLRMVSVDAPSDAVSGQPFSLTWTVENLGGGSDRTWYDAVYLSGDENLDPSSDDYLGCRYQNGLAAGDSYTARQEFTLPRGLAGTFWVFVRADSGNAEIREPDEFGNNTGYDDNAVNVSMPPSVDLAAGIVSIPDMPATGTLGRDISITYRVDNASDNAVVGNWQDALYLSADTVWDVGDARFARVTHTGGLAAHSGYSQTAIARVPGVLPGDYHVILRSDIRNQVAEANETNNLSVSPDQVRLEADPLQLGVPATGRLDDNQSVYYRIDVPEGETLQLRLDSGAMGNELYIRYGAIPTRGVFDYAATAPNAGDQEILVPSTKAGTYYILVYGNTVSGTPAYSVQAQALPFSLRGAQPREVGNAGDVTLAIQGARFAATTGFALIAPDGTAIIARSAWLDDSSEAHATFDLFNTPLGVYDLVAIQEDGSTASLADAVTVVDGEGAKVFLSIEGLSQVGANRLNRLTLSYANDGDTDTLAPLIRLESPSSTPLGFTANDLRTTPTFLLGASLDGRMDVLRPGAAYTQSVLFRSPMENAQLDIRASRIYADDSRIIEDWNALKNAFRPLGMADTDWTPFWNRLQDTIGTTWGDLVQVLDRMMVMVSEPGSPVRDVRQVFSRMIADHPDFVPFATITGALLDASSYLGLAGVELAAYLRAADGNLTLGGTATTSANGAFSIHHLPAGEYVLSLNGLAFDMNLDGEPDAAQPVVTLAENGAADFQTLYARTVSVDSTPADSEPLLITDSAGVSHLFWIRGGGIWHTWYDSKQWVGGQPISDATGFNVAAAAASNLIDGSVAGIVAAWQTGNENTSEVWYAIGRPAAGGGYQWSAPVQLTSDSLEDNAPVVAIMPTGEALITYVKRNSEVQDDFDVYYSVVDVDSGALVWSGIETNLAELQPEDQSYSINLWQWDLGEVEFLGLGGGAKFTLSGDITQSDCGVTAGLTGKLGIELRMPGFGRIIGEGSSTLNGYWTVDIAAEDWRFNRAQSDGTVQVTFQWRDGLFKVLNAIPPLAPAATAIRTATSYINRRTSLNIENGINFGPIGFEAKNVRWSLISPLPVVVWPTSVEELSFFLSAGPYLTVTQRGVSDAQLSVSGSLGGKFKIYPQFAAQLTYGVQLTAKLWGWDSSAQWSGAWPESLDMTAIQDAIGPYEVVLTYDPASVVGTGNDYGDSVLTDVTTDLWRDSAMVMGRDSNGTVFGVWAKDQDPYGSDIGSRLYVSEFTDSGWTAPLMVPDSLGFNDSAALGVDAMGNRMLVWSKTSTAGLSTSITADELQTVRDGAEMYYSVDDGSGWSMPQLLAITDGKDRSATLAQDASGNLVLAWSYFDGSDGDVVMSASWDGHAWDTPNEVARGRVDGLSIGVVGGATTLFWNLDTNADPEKEDFEIHYAALGASGWLDDETFIPQVLTEASSLMANPGQVPIQTLAIFPPFSVPEECLRCRPEDIRRVMEAAPTCRDGGGTEVNYDADTCTERTISYRPCTVRPTDPNDILGPIGFGEDQWISASEALPYTIRFENKAEATAPAQQVVITQQLDDDLDWRSFRLGDFGWGDHYFELPGNSAFYSGRVDLTASHGFLVDVTASIDVATGIATWTLTSIDPATGEIPEDVMVGLLPPNNPDGTGNGFVSYTVQPKLLTTTGSRLDAEATIVFDTVEPISTPPIFNTLDVTPPESSVHALPESSSTGFLVTWGGTDVGSAIRDYTIYVSDNGREYRIWQLFNTATEALYTGVVDHTYAFYSVARDNAGNEEMAPSSFDARTTAGNVALGRVEGVKFEDVDGDGVKDAGEPGLAGWTVFLDTDRDGTLDAGEATALTGSNGAYAFDGLAAGSYHVREVLQTGWLRTLPAGDAHVVDLAAGAMISGLDFGNFRPGEISGSLYRDLDSGGDRDPGDPALAGWTLYLDADDDGVLDAGEINTSSNAGGNYRFADLGPGSYRVREVVQEYWTTTAPASGVHEVVMTSGLAAGGRDFGNYQQPATLRGIKFEDLDGDGTRDPDEMGLSGWTLFLDADGDGLLDTDERATVTGTDGSYEFSSLEPGAYSVMEVLQPGWRQTYPGAGDTSAGEETLWLLTGASAASLETPDELCVTDMALMGTGDPGWAASLTGLDAFRADSRFSDITGEGVAVAVIDTGIDPNHAFFGVDSDLNGIADRIVFQYDFAEHDADASDLMGHGSVVSSIIGSSDSVYTGVAPDADLLALKVFEDSGSGYFLYVEQALQWVARHAEEYGIGVVNLSLGDGNNWSSAASRYGLGDELAALAAQNILVVGAAGNSYYRYQMPGVAYPAADPNVIGVGAVWAGDYGGPWRFSTGAIDYSTDADHLTSFSQRDALMTEVFAPGARLTGANATGGVSTMQGTSQAAAYLSGVAALAQDLALTRLGRMLSPAEFSTLLIDTSMRILDGDDEHDNVRNTALAYGRIDVLGLAEGILSLNGTDSGSGAGSDGDTSGGGNVRTAGLGHNVQVSAGETLSNIDFGNFHLGSISGIVFDDYDANGLHGDGDSGLSGWTVYLDADSDGVLNAGEESIVTDADGAYQFGDLGPGTRRVSVFDPGGWSYTTERFFDVFIESGNASLRDFGVNRMPTASDDSFSGDEDQILSGNVSGNDVDLDGPGYTAQLASSPAHGSLVLNNDGIFTYTPDADWNGSDSFAYKANDGSTNSNLATVSLTVNPVNDDPVAVDDSYSVNEDSVLNVPASGVLGNDSDLDGNSLNAILVTGPLHGSLSLDGDGSFSYAPDVNFNGPDSFTYRANDGSTNSNLATVTLTINPVNNDPEAADDSYSVNEDAVLNVPANGLLGNDSDLDGDSLNAILVTGPLHGSLSLDGDGSFSYSPDVNYNGPDSFTYKANDGSTNSNLATVSLTVNPVNDKPTADPIPTRHVNEGQSVNLGVVGHDLDGDSLSYTLISGPGNIDPATGAYSFAAPDGDASHTVGVRISDGQGVDSFFDVTFDLSVHNVAPTLAISGPTSGNEGHAYSLTLASSDPGSDTLSGWIIHWGDGTVSTYSGDATAASHIYAAAGSYSISAIASDEDGDYAATGPTVGIAAASFRITAFTQTDSGFHLDFSRAVDPSVLNLYSGQDDGRSPMGTADLVLTQAGAYYPVRGSLLLDADRMGATFLKSNGVFAADSYTLTLSSRADGFRDLAGHLLDGNGDGTAGDNYVHTFTVVPSSSAILSVGEVSIGPDQTINIPAASGSGLPISLSTAAGLNRASFKLGYDPTLFNFTSISFGTGISDNGSSIDTVNGLVSINVTATGLGSGTIELVRLLGSVPADVPYGAKQLLDLHDVVLDDGNRAVRVDDGLHLAAFVADASGNGGYAALDQTRMQRVIGLLDSGFNTYPLVDPVIIGDVNNSVNLTSADVLLFARELNWLATGNAANDRPEIPAITTTPTVFSGADPVVNIPRNLLAVAGGLVTVPVMLAEIEAGLDSIPLVSAVLDLAWDPGQLELLGVGRGSLTVDFDLFNAAQGPGTLHLDMSRLSALDVAYGSLAELTFRVAPGASGTVAVDLVQAQLNDTHLSLNPAPQAGADPTDGSIRVNLPHGLDLSASANVANPQTVAAAQIASPVIDFGSRYNGFDFGGKREPGWLGDWLTERKVKKPNLEALRIQPKVTPKLSARL